MKQVLIYSLVVLALSASAQVGQSFPAMETETLENEILNLPEDLQGKYTIIGLAYSKAAEDDLKTWFSPAYNQFMREPDKTNIFATEYDINLFFIPMLTGHKTVAYKSVMEKVQESVDKHLHHHVLFYKGQLKEYRDALDLDKKSPTFLLLDDSGKIIWKTSGSYSQQKMQEVVDHLDEALGEW